MTLVELAVVLTVLGILLGGALRILAAYSEAQFVEVTRGRLAAVEEALILYAARNKRLPCPADGTLDDGDAGDQPNLGVAVPTGAVDDCTVATTASVVPWRELGIPRENALDAWRRRITYRVFDGTTGLTRQDGIDASDCRTAADDDTALGADPCDNTRSAIAFLSGKGFQVNDGGGTAIIGPALPERGGGAAFVLVSHGPGGFCGYLRSGTRQNQAGGSTCAVNAGKDENGDGDDTFVLSEFAEADVNAFDDLLRAPTVHEIADGAELGPQ